MEARGFEPRSESDSDAAPTCVGDAFYVSLPWRLAGPGSNKPLPTLAQPVRAPGHTSPTLRYVSAASGGLPLTQVHKPKLMQPGPTQCWQLKRASCFAR